MSNSNEINDNVDKHHPKSAEILLTQVSAFKMRVRAAIVLIGVIGLLGIAIYLEPARLERVNSGYSFLKPCGFLHSTGYPCPTCFMTRSFVYMMHGRIFHSFLIQPFGAFLCLLVIYLGYGAIKVLITGKPWQPIWTGVSKKVLVIILISAFLGAWIFVLIYGTFVTGKFPITLR